MPFRLVPPLWGPRLRIRFVPCSMRFTGWPRLIPGDGFMRCGTRSFAGTSWGQAVEERVVDQAVLKLLRVMLRSGVMQDGIKPSPHQSPRKIEAKPGFFMKVV